MNSQTDKYEVSCLLAFVVCLQIPKLVRGRLVQTAQGEDPKKQCPFVANLSLQTGPVTIDTTHTSSP